MKIEIHVKPNSRRERVEKTATGLYRISVNAPPQDGRANSSVIRLLSDHFGVPKRSITIVRGHSGRKKLVEVQE